MSTEVEVFQTPLNQQHRDRGAKMVEFGGWDMPLQYTSILEEWDANRKAVSIFDCSHMGEFILEGDLVESGLDRIVTQRLSDAKVGECRYGCILNEQGGVIDDCIVYRLADARWMIVVNASNIEKNAAHIQLHLASEAVFDDQSFQMAKLDIQGPLSREVLKNLAPVVQDLEYYYFQEIELLGERAIISRTGYTGELGFEIYFPWREAGQLWEAILNDKRVQPTGLGVRDVLRTEMCYPLYGHEISESVSPLDAGLRRFVDLDKDFIGKKALLEYDQKGVQHQTICLVSDSRRSPRESHLIYTQEGKEIGRVASGVFSPALERGIGLAMIEKSSAKIGDYLQCGNEKKKFAVEVVKRPFYRNGTLKN